MCGIAGIYLTSSAYDDGLALPEKGRVGINEIANRMVKSLGHRGPDDQGTWASQESMGQVALGHTRLSILDLSAAGHQPMPDPLTGNRITYNGEVYNYRELRSLLGEGDGAWRSQTDTEVILRAYSKWGRDCLDHFRGMFAFAIWDAQKQMLFIARDQLGIKPLYYYLGDGFFVFASEVRTLLASGLVRPLIDPIALDEYLTYQSVPAPRTLIKGVHTLLPGSWLTIDASGKIGEGQYWSLLENCSPEARFATKAESHQRVAELLRESTALHMVSDVPVAAFLSGGIDSTAVAALMREAGHTPRTFAVVFTEGAYTEARHAMHVAAQLRTDHTEILLTEQTLLDQLPDALAAMDQPTGDGINTYVVSRAVRSAGVKVALSGLGGDEFFGGYPSFARLGRVARYLRLWGTAPVALRSFAAKAVNTMTHSSVAAVKAASILESDGSIASAFLPMRQVLSPSQRRALLKEPWLQLIEEARDPYLKLLQDAFARAPQAETLSQISYAEARTYMHDVLLRDTDQMSMAHALEVRVPLLDHKLVEYVMAVPDTHKRSNGIPKRLLVESLHDLLPKEVVHRPKQGFMLPFDLWMRGALRRFCEERLSVDRIGGRGIMHADQVQKLWHDYLDGRPNVSWSRLWVLVVLEEWLEHNGIVCEH